MLVLLTAIPVAAGVHRLVQLATITTPPPEDVRFFDAPLPIVLHIVGASVFAVLGALQFVPRLRRRRPDLHRRLGWLLVVAGALAVVSAFWMMIRYPMPAHEAPVLYVFRTVFGALIVGALIMGVRAALHRDFVAHGAWMLRAYAVAMAAGTQSLVLAPFVVIGGPIEPVPSALIMAACWMLNLGLAEWWIRRRPLSNPERMHARLVRAALIPSRTR